MVEFLKHPTAGNSPEAPTVVPHVELSGPEIFLPAGTLGQFETAILDSAKDGQERSQVIKSPGGGRHRKNSRGLQYSKVYRGNSGNIGMRAALSRERINFTGKGLVAYHTHPSGIDQFSEGDIADIVALPNLAKVHLVGTPDGISALVSDISETDIIDKEAAFDDTVRYLQEHGYRQAADEKQHDSVQRILQGLNLRYYRAPEPVTSGSLSQGLRLRQPLEE